MLALAKPPSMSRGRGHEEGGGRARLIVDDCLKYLFIVKRLQEKEIHSLNLKLFYG
jgi:hypothetical protein